LRLHHVSSKSGVAKLILKKIINIFITGISILINTNQNGTLLLKHNIKFFL
jgi:hypothetical protein